MRTSGGTAAILSASVAFSSEAEDRGQADREDQEREREEHVRDPGDHRVELAPVVAGGEAEAGRR